MPNTYVALRTETVAVATNTVTFSLSGISGYTDLVLVMNGTLTGTGAVYCEFNGDTASNYSSTYIQGQSGTASSNRDTRLFLFGLLTSGAGQNVGIANIMNYSNATTFKTVLSRANDTSTVNANVGLWRSTSAITSIALKTSANNFSIGTTFSLYGIANADQGSAKATGGIITEDSQYWYHTFGASGAFVPKQSLTCDVLVVAGGGGGGGTAGGGGGSGGAIAYASQSLTAISHNVTVGAGGSGGNGTSVGTNGVNSSFAALSAGVGGGRGGSRGGTIAGASGGSGGGGTYLSGAGGSGTQGNAGGSGSGSNGTGGGGGGAGAVGANAVTTTPGVGGAGVNTVTNWGALSSVLVNTGLGVSGFIAGGGGGGNDNTTGATGGSGGGGAANIGSSGGSAGTVNTGSGGGGGGFSTAAIGGAGGSGLVIVRYAK